MINCQSAAALADFQADLRRRYLYTWFISETGAIMCMNELGTEIHFLSVFADNGAVERAADVTVSTQDTISVELVNNERSVTESTTTTRKNKVITRAIVGDLLFGDVGAIVGATSAGSTSQTVGIERQVYLSSELVFGLKDLANPVPRFISEDHAESDRWLHRVRSAMAHCKGDVRPHLA